MNTSPRDEPPPPVSGVPSFPDTAGWRAWMAAVTGPVAGATRKALAARSADSIPIGPLYHKSDEPPVLRNATHPRVFGRVDHPDAALANALALEDLEGGASGLVLVLEGAPASRGFGLRIDARDGVDAILSGVRLEAVALRFESGALEAPVAWRGIADAVERGAGHPSTAEIDFGLDPIGAMAAGAGSAPWPEVGRQAAAAVADVRGWGFRTPVLRADGRPHHEAGASEAQELAAVLATAVAYLRALETAGQMLEEACASVSFTLVADADVALSLAKMRALRRLWAAVADGCRLPPRPLALHAETAWRMLTRRDPSTNLLRGTFACAAALLGGADGVAVLPHTAALGLPDAFARRLARNTALVLLEEAHLCKVADPAAGSGAFDALTAALCAEAWRVFQAVEREGGMAAALASGSWQAQIAGAQARRTAAFAGGGRLIVGTSSFVDPHPPAVAVLPVTPRFEAPSAAAQRVPALVNRRDAEPFEAAAAAPEDARP